MNLKSLNHSVYQLEYHLVFATYRRIQWITLNYDYAIHSCIENVLDQFNSEKIALSVQLDHIHLLFSAPPTTPISKIVGMMKQQMNKISPFADQKFQTGYFISSVGISDDVIQTYIASQ